MASAEPSSTEQSPPSTTGNSPRSMIAPIRSASAAEYAGDLRRVADPVAGAPVARVVPGRGEAAGVAGAAAGRAGRGRAARPGPWRSRARRWRWAGAGRGSSARRGRRSGASWSSRPRWSGGPAGAPARVGASNSEQRAGQGPPGGGDRRVVRAGDGEERRPGAGGPSPGLAGGPPDQADQPRRTPARRCRLSTSTSAASSWAGDVVGVGLGGGERRAAGRRRRPGGRARPGPGPPRPRRPPGVSARIFRYACSAASRSPVISASSASSRRGSSGLGDGDAAGLEDRVEPLPQLRLGHHAGEGVDRAVRRRRRRPSGCPGPGTSARCRGLASHVDPGQHPGAAALGGQPLQHRGELCLQGSHHSAQKSTTTGVVSERSSTSDWKVASVTSSTAAPPPGAAGAARHAGRRAARRAAVAGRVGRPVRGCAAR